MRFRKILGISAVIWVGGYKVLGDYVLDEETFMTIEQRLEKYGLKWEKHFVTTEDDYILWFHRVVNPQNEGKDLIPVVLNHQIWDSSLWWTINKEKSGAIILAKDEFDVWLANSRGNAFSRMHKTMDPDTNPKYWDFTFEEMGLYDSKACIEYVKKNTGKDKIAVLGNSQGSALNFYGLAKRQEWFKDHLSIFIAMNPVVNPGKTACPEFKKTLEKAEMIYGLLNFMGINEIPKRQYFARRIYGIYMALLPGRSTSSLKNISDKKIDLIDTASFQRQHVNIPYGSSLKMFKYWKQIMDRGIIVDFDYGEEENLKRYGCSESPAIDLAKITDTPVAMIVGKYDYIDEIQDHRRLKDMLNPNVLKAYYEFEEHGHFSFVGGKDASHWNIISKLIKEYSR